MKRVVSLIACGWQGRGNKKEDRQAEEEERKKVGIVGVDGQSINQSIGR